MRQRFERGEIPAKYEGPGAGTIAWYKWGIGVCDMAINTALFVWNKSLGWLIGHAEYVQTSLPPNIPRVVDALMRVHGAQLLADGVFQADPHGGYRSSHAVLPLTPCGSL